ncbi:hypothetical protein CDQ91_07820 [Sphingopyxis witflariensis]|uniref:SHOCT domain-containing protein n=2 Tax=Sphingopyxis witflariensis TaxID=173675 RepID=A0A246JYV8_9SPHN|nr:hypothetical protein CDQ91_07820 [Sphingopyxis witflariensis]
MLGVCALYFGYCAYDLHTQISELLSFESSSHLKDELSKYYGALGLLAITAGIISLPWQRLVIDLNKVKGVRLRAQKTRDSAQIIGRDKLTSYSVADELQKWQKLHEDGVVTAEEFEQTKAKLLRR